MPSIWTRWRNMATIVAFRIRKAWWMIPAIWCVSWLPGRAVMVAWLINKGVTIQTYPKHPVKPNG
jgi:hypothetical protein